MGLGETPMSGDTTPTTTTPPIAPPPANGTTANSLTTDSVNMLNISEQTAQFVVKAFAVTVCAIMLAITIVLCYRVVVDGNAPLTEQITQQLTSVFPWLAFSMVASIVGKPAAQAILAKFLP